MSIIHFDSISAAAADISDVTLSGGSVSHSMIIFSLAGFRFSANGTVLDRELGTYIQISPLTDWIIPNLEASIDYEIRATFVAGGATLQTIAPTVLDTFQPLDIDRDYFAQCGQPCFQSLEFIVDIRYQDGTNLTINNEVSLEDGVPVMASAQYFISIVATSP